LLAATHVWALAVIGFRTAHTGFFLFCFL